MFDLDTLTTLNRNASRKLAETETTRHCSFCASRSGVVLHSAKLRNTAFIRGATATAFTRRWNATRSAVVRDSLVESYFQF